MVASTTTNGSGAYSLSLGGGDYTIEASKPGYETQTEKITVQGSAISGVDFRLAIDDSYRYTVGVCYSTDAEFRASTAEATWGHAAYSSITPYVDERADLPAESKWGFKERQFDTLYNAPLSTIAVFRPVGGQFGQYPAETTFDYNGETTTVLEPYNASHDGMAYRVEITTDRAYMTMKRLDPRQDYNQLVFPGIPTDTDNQTTVTSTPGGPCSGGDSALDGGQGPTAIGTCQVPTASGTKTGVTIEYYDETYSTTELDYNVTYNNQTYTSTLTFDVPKGYVYECVGAGNVDDDAGPPELDLEAGFANGTSTWYNETGFSNSTSGALLGGGGGIVPSDAGAGAPVWTLAIPAVAAVGYAIVQRRGNGAGSGPGGGGGGGGLF